VNIKQAAQSRYFCCQFMEIKIDPDVEKFINSLNKATIAKVLRTIELLEKFENNLGMPHSKKVSGGLFELRVRGQQEVRIFYCFFKDKIFLLSAFNKKTRKIPLRELRNAELKYRRLTGI